LPPFVNQNETFGNQPEKPFICKRILLREMDAVNSNPQYMSPETKEQYISPVCTVYEIKPEGVLAASGGEFDPYTAGGTAP
jgi:hypothetical protein